MAKPYPGNRAANDRPATIVELPNGGADALVFAFATGFGGSFSAVGAVDWEGPGGWPMDELVVGILVGIFALVVLAGAIAWRGAYLEKLPAIAGEQTLFEERGIKVETEHRIGRGTRFPNSLLRLTTQRMIVAQQVLFRRNSHALRFVILLDGTPDASNARGTMGALTRGYTTFRASRADLELVRDNGRTYLRIPSHREHDMAVPAELRVSTRRAEELEALLP